MRRFSFLLAVLAMIHSGWAQHWDLLNPRATDEPLWGVSFCNDSTGMAVGPRGTAVVTNSAGHQWYSVPMTGEFDFTAVKSIDEAESWAVGTQGRIFHRQPGSSWGEISSGTSENLAAVEFPAANLGWITGAHGTVIRVNGQTCTPLQLGEINLNAVVFPDPQKGWIVGANGVIYHTTDQGNQWTFQPSGTGSALYGAAFFDEHEGWAVGDYGAVIHYRQTDTSEAWTPDSQVVVTPLRDVVCLGDSVVVAVGGSFRGLATVIRSTNRGRTWDSLAVGPQLNLVKAARTQNGRIWAVGGYWAYPGTILSSADSGRTWVECNTITRADLYDVALFSPAGTATGWIVGEAGTILRSHAATLTFQNSRTRRDLFCLCALDTTRAWAAGDSGVILSTADGGNNWTIQTGSTNRWLQGISFIDPMQGWAVGRSGVILHTTDGGGTWLPQSSSSTAELYDVSFASDHGFAVGDFGTILHTSDQGSTWEIQSSGTPNALYSIQLASSTNSRWMAAGTNGTVLESADFGEHWIPIQSGITTLFYDLSPSVNGIGWAVGASGSVWFYDWPYPDLPRLSTITRNELLGTAAAAEHIWVVGREGTIATSVIPLSTISRTGIPLPSDYGISAYPNPFNPGTTITLDLPHSGPARLAIYDLQGRLVRILADGNMTQGRHQIYFEASNLSSGMYFTRLSALDAVRTEKLILLK